MAEFSEYKPGTPSWIDLQTADPDKGVEFYRGLFGWEAQDLGPEAGGYRFLLKDGKMVGGAGPKMMDEAPSNWMTYIAVADADETAKKVEKAGGTVLAPPMDVMTAGRMGVFAASSQARTFDFQGGDVGYVPFAMGHYVENTGSATLRFLEMFKSSYYADVSLDQWIALTPPGLIQAHLRVDQHTLDALRKDKKPLVPA